MARWDRCTDESDNCARHAVPVQTHRLLHANFAVHNQWSSAIIATNSHALGQASHHVKEAALMQSALTGKLALSSSAVLRLQPAAAHARESRFSAASLAAVVCLSTCKLKARPQQSDVLDHGPCSPTLMASILRPLGPAISSLLRERTIEYLAVPPESFFVLYC